LLRHELDLVQAKITVLADKQADKIYWKQPRRTGLFPNWIPGTCAALLFHGDQQVTKGIPVYDIRDAAHMPAMKEYLIRCSKEATGCDKSWDEATYDSIDWCHFGEVFKKLSHGRRIQISKYTTNDLLPTKQCLATLTTEGMDDALPAIGCSM
jgi:hypothetical protein